MYTCIILIHVHVFACRKQWVKRQHIVHSYGEEDLIDTSDLRAQLGDCISDGTVTRSIPPSVEQPHNIDIIVSGRKCKCGSTTHQRVSHKECPLRKK